MQIFLMNLFNSKVFCEKILDTFICSLDSINWWQRLQSETYDKMCEITYAFQTVFRGDTPNLLFHTVTHDLGLFFWLGTVVLLELISNIRSGQNEQVIAIFWNASSATTNIPIYSNIRALESIFEYLFEYSNIAIIEY